MRCLVELTLTAPTQAATGLSARTRTSLTRGLSSSDFGRAGRPFADPVPLIEDLKQFGYHLEVPGLIACEEEGFEV